MLKYRNMIKLKTVSSDIFVWMMSQNWLEKYLCDLTTCEEFVTCAQNY